MCLLSSTIEHPSDYSTDTTSNPRHNSYDTIPAKMRQYLIDFRIHIILFIISFALAVPLVIRERHEVHADVVDVAKDGTVASQTPSQTPSRWDPRDGWLPVESQSEDSEEWNDPFLGPESSDESDPEPGPNSSGSETRSGSTSSTESSPGPPLGSTHAYPSPGGAGGMASHDAVAGLLLLSNSLAEANPSESSPDRSSPHQTPSGSSSSTYPGLAAIQWVADDPSRIAWYEALKAPHPILSSTDSDFTYSLGSNSQSTSSGSTGSDYPYSTGSGSTGSDGPYSTSWWSTVPDYYSTGSGSMGSDYSYSTGLGPTEPTGTEHSDSTGSGASPASDSSPSSNLWDRMPTDTSTSSLSTKHSLLQSPGQTDNHLPASTPPDPASSTAPQQSTDGLTPTIPKPQSSAESESDSFLSKLLKGKIKRHSSHTIIVARRELQGALD